jgi:hypothetical protein
MAILAVSLLATGGTVAYAEDDPTTTTTTEAAPEPTVTIVVEDVPAPTTEPETSAVVTTTVESAAAEDSPPEPSVVAVREEPEEKVEVAPTTTHNPVQISADETAVITGTQQAEADTGNNHTETDTPNGSGQQPNDIDTGDVDAVGSDDVNIVSQEAAVKLTEQAVANLIQVALILNIGAALANSGLNDTVSAPGGSGIIGALDSGNATAIGNDMEQYITQAARATGGDSELGYQLGNGNGRRRIRWGHRIR